MYDHGLLKVDEDEYIFAIHIYHLYLKYIIISTLSS